eukprot:TRINITY_DN26884_c0_g1_i1.p1 TRINITY_DN26884_c0_g1~~TRINITY_DN26884_c0_g1_i1.p1  ORF type:complete len:106 (-),score=13.15 TRINITY_DN26884_c0_g1_i1:85-402(-)
MKKTTPLLIVLVGFILLFHSAFLVFRHKHAQKLIDGPEEPTPSYILAEAIASVIVTGYGALLLSGTFKDIKMTSEIASIGYDVVHSRSDFLVFNHRARLLHVKQS